MWRAPPTRHRAPWLTASAMSCSNRVNVALEIMAPTSTSSGLSRAEPRRRARTRGSKMSMREG